MRAAGTRFPTCISFVLAVWALCATQAYGQNPSNTSYVETELNGVTACSQPDNLFSGEAAAFAPPVGKVRRSARGVML